MAGQELVATDSMELVESGGEKLAEFVTFNIAGQLFGIPVLIVQDILVPENIASVPLSPPEVRGSINLRGRIVTVVDVRVRLGLERRAIRMVEDGPTAGDDSADDAVADDESPEMDPPTADPLEDAEDAEDADEAVEAASSSPSDDGENRKIRQHMMGVTVEHHNDLYTLLVDSVGDVIGISKNSFEGNPSTLDPVWRDFASGVYRLDTALMVVLDVERLLDFEKHQKS